VKLAGDIAPLLILDGNHFAQQTAIFAIEAASAVRRKFIGGLLP